MRTTELHAERLKPPAPGASITIAGETVTCRKCKCCPDQPPMFYVRNADGELLAAGQSFRALAHWRRWQLDPVIKFRWDWSWPDSDLNAFQLLVWSLARTDLSLGDIATPIPSIHPDCVRPAVELPAEPEPRRPAPPPRETYVRPEFDPAPEDDPRQIAMFSLAGAQ